MAIAASIAALSNAGPVLGFAPDAAGNVLGLDMMQAYAAMAPGAKLVLAIAMIAGRIEVLAAAAVLAALRTTDSADEHLWAPVILRDRYAPFHANPVLHDRPARQIPGRQR